MLEKLLKGDRRALAKAITLCESQKEDRRLAGRSLLEAAMGHTGKAIRLAISGPPGVGKSSFIEKLGKLIIEDNKKVSVLAIDPSSPIRQGSILGDKTRMPFLSASQNAFVRPSPTSGQLGGTSAATRESILLSEAAGYDVILVETVGVGQSEVDAAQMVDIFIMLQLPHAGDELQGIKKGILEMADIIGITKCDGTLIEKAKQAQREHINALSFASIGQDAPDVLCVSNETGEGIATFWQHILSLCHKRKQSGGFEAKRSEQRRLWLKKEISAAMNQLLLESHGMKEAVKKHEKKVYDGLTPASLAAYRIVKAFKEENYS